MNIRLLDCTLRDGGYINDWNFGYFPIRSMIRKLVEAQTDFVEVGFLRSCIYDRDKTLFNNTEEIKAILPKFRGGTKFVAMALHNLYNIEKLEPYDGTTIDAVRVTFHDYDVDEGLAFCRKVIEKGYKCFCNPINIMGYSDSAILELIRKINEIKPYAFSIVDTFGSMLKNDLSRIYLLLEHNLDRSITIGLHLHENLSLSYSLAQDFLTMCSDGRNCVIDGSLLGMGRVPGNLCIELMMDYMNRYWDGRYNTEPVYDAIDDHIVEYKKTSPWGYSAAYALSAKYNLHRNYAEYLIHTGKLRTRDISQILASIAENKKTAFDKKYIADLYYNYQSVQVDDTDARDKLYQSVKNKTILVLAPGSTLVRYETQLREFICKEHPVMISANFESSNYPSDFLFFSNLKRYEDYCSENVQAKVMVTSNLTHFEKKSDMVFNYHDLMSDECGIFDNCVIMLLRLLHSLSISKVYLAGFDGYSDNNPNYAKSELTNNYCKGMDANEMIKPFVQTICKKMEIIFLTPSLYQEDNEA